MQLTFDLHPDGLREKNMKFPHMCLGETIGLKFKQMKSTTKPRTNFAFLACEPCPEIQRVPETAPGPFVGREQRQADHEVGCSWKQRSISVTLSHVHAKVRLSLKAQRNHEEYSLQPLGPHTKWITLDISNSEGLQSKRTKKKWGEERK